MESAITLTPVISRITSASDSLFALLIFLHSSLNFASFANGTSFLSSNRSVIHLLPIRALIRLESSLLIFLSQTLWLIPLVLFFNFFFFRLYPPPCPSQAPQHP